VISIQYSVFSIQYSVFGIQIGEWTGRKKGVERRGRWEPRISLRGRMRERGAVGNGDGLLHKKFLQWARFAQGGLSSIMVSSLGGDFSPQRLDGRRGVGRGDWRKMGGRNMGESGVGGQR